MQQLMKAFSIALIYVMSNGETNSASESADPTNQELALLDWSAGIRVSYCTDAPLEILVDPFKQALVQSLNKFCRNATACRLAKSITFEPYYIVLLDGYPRLNYGAVQFRFVVVLPPNAVSIDQSTKPLLTKQILSNFLNTSVGELERKLGWKVSSYERFPKFDSVTEFMNVALIPIGIVLLIFMLLLAYWSSVISSRSSGGAEEWFVSGSKSAAMKRTLEIIEQQKNSFTEKDGLKEPCCGKLPRPSIQIVAKRATTDKCDGDDASKNDFTENSRERQSVEVTLLHPPVTRSESTSTLGSLTTFKNVGGRRASHRRLSSIDDGNFNIKRHRRKRVTSRTRRLTQRQWKLTSMALSGFGKSQRY